MKFAKADFIAVPAQAGTQVSSLTKANFISHLAACMRLGFARHKDVRRDIFVPTLIPAQAGTQVSSLAKANFIFHFAPFMALGFATHVARRMACIVSTLIPRMATGATSARPQDS